MRNPTKKKEEKKEEVPEVPEAPAAPAETEGAAPIIEREINLSLINDKLNYLISTTNKIAEACEVNLNE